jgi:hypothetical protein
MVQRIAAQRIAASPSASTPGSAPRTVEFTRYGPGEAAESFTRGDFILTHGNKTYDRLVHWAQGLQMHGEDRKYTRWNHAALIVDDGGTIVEANGNGVCQNPISKYTPTEYYLVHILAEDVERDNEVAFGMWAQGQEYGKMTICSVFLSLAFGSTIIFALQGQEICSGLVARALERAGYIFDQDPAHIMPADLAKYFEVEPPEKGTPKGLAPK